MAIKKSDLYSALWKGADELRGSMDASQYKDYVLVILFVKYVTDKYRNIRHADIEIPQGGSFDDMIAVKNATDIGDKINKIIGTLAQANNLTGIIDVADFNDENKLGRGKDMVDTLTKLVGIFENPALNFSNNRADGDDLLGDAYEYLMRHFATESGKSKGQFYTPSEVSRVLAKVVGVSKATSQEQTIYDPTCGSGSLLLKASDETPFNITIYGQEKDSATLALSKMNMILHNNPTADIRPYNTLSSPFFKDESQTALKTFDFVVSNPPFSLKSWNSGFDPASDIYDRFEGFGIPPDKNGDYAFLLHVIKSLKSSGKGAVILPHGVLFRGNAEARIRENIIKRGLIKGIIGLPANLFYGTGIPACVIIIDKENAQARTGIFMIDASKSFIKDGNKNRLRERDIHKIVDVFNKQIEIPKYSRMVPLSEISDPKNDYNLNIPRYIDSAEAEDLQNIEAHLKGGIPNTDIDSLDEYWSAYPSMRSQLFAASNRAGFSQLKVDKEHIKQTIFAHSEFVTFSQQMGELFDSWKAQTATHLKAQTIGYKPKELIYHISESLLVSYTGKPLMDKYAVYQHLMDYWNESMQDDCYIVALDGWKAELEVVKKTKKDTIYDCELVPKSLVIDRCFKAQKEAIEELEADKESLAAQMEELAEEHSGEDGYFAEMEKVNKANIQKRLKEIKNDKDAKDEVAVLESYIAISDKITELNSQISKATIELESMTIAKYPTLTVDEIKTLVVDDKWMNAIEKAVKTEMERLSQRLTGRIKELAERYESPLPKLQNEAKELEAKVAAHLAKMGFEI
jgi:type I restriction enzyme M protein